MKKLILATLAAAALVMAAPSSAVAAHQPGGCVGGIVGCCFGIRAAGDYNEGKDISIREWLRIVPFVSFVVGIMDALDGYNGKTRTELHDAQPTYF